MSKVNDLMALVYFVKVKKVDGTKKLDVVDVDRGQDFSVLGKELIDSMYSADEYRETKEVTQTEMAKILMRSHNVPFTVVFTKKDLTERRLRGRLIDTEPVMGRCQVEDLDIEGKGESRFRLVDNRTLKVLIVKGVKYVLK